MNVGSLFSGIGGLDLGLHRAGMRHVFFCESDPWRRSVLAHHWPGVPIYEDVRLVAGSGKEWRGADAVTGRGGTDTATAAELRPVCGGESDVAVGASSVDLLCGGFPCQDVSVAGRRAGLAGERSGLFHEFARITESLRPRWLLVENVPGLLSSNGGRDFGVVLGTLADIGYGVAWRIVDSRFFGVPQRRRRVFIVGTLADGDPRAAAERAGQVLAVGSRCERHPATRGEAGPEPAVASLSGLGSGGPDDNGGQGGRLIADTVRSHPRPGSNSDGNLAAYGFNTGRGGNADDCLAEERTPPITGRHGDPGGVLRGQSVRRLTPTECERLQALPDGWTDFGPDSRRYAALGDAVTASVAEWIGGRILSEEASNRRKRFRKKPVVIEAVRFTGDNVDECLGFIGAPREAGEEVGDFQTIDIDTLEGTMETAPGDWIIKGVAGEFYPCKPDIFDATYEAVE